MKRAKYLIIFIAIASVSFFIYRVFDLIVWEPWREDTASTLSKSTQEPGDLAPPLSEGSRLDEMTHPSWSDFVYPTQADMRDPFQQKVAQAGSANRGETSSSFAMLTGVLYNEQDPIAIFVDKDGNSYLVRENEEIFDSIVKRILKRSVILERAGMDTELNVFDEEGLLESQAPGPQIQKPSDISSLGAVGVDQAENEAEDGKRDEIRGGDGVEMGNTRRTEVPKKGGMTGNPLNDKVSDSIIPELQKRAEVPLNSKRGTKTPRD